MPGAVPTFELLNRYQRDFPLEPRPFARIAAELGLSEDTVIDMLAALSDDGTVSRVGAVVRPNVVGASTLAAMSVPASRLEEVAATVSRRPDVNHNYEREHALNLWFVVTARDPDALARALGEIAAETGLDVIDLPLERAYHIDLGFDLA
jgi:DNA-binding Lrp family transcriptional regulator